MINQEELRKGNLVMHGNDVCTFLSIKENTNAIDEAVLSFNGEKRYVEINSLRGVCLNPKWMDVLGFKYKTSGAGGTDMWSGYNFWENHEFKIYLLGHKKISKEYPLYYDRCYDFKFIYFHEVQNLILALTKKDIKIT